jgi:integrase
LATGLRWGELIRATAADIQAGTLVVHHTKSRRVRRVPLPQAIQEELRMRVSRLLPFTNSSGFTRQVRRNSGIERFHPHQLRHTFACRWLEAGGSPAALQELLGHTSIVTTQRYARLGEAHVRDEVARLEGRLSPGLSPAGVWSVVKSGVTC